ncbi:MAG: hypothetical protein KDE03_17875 [Rhodobacteraceae bacterium]|nr:hypothetical protein [Paracoccaceae bacterium]
MTQPFVGGSGSFTGGSAALPSGATIRAVKEALEKLVGATDVKPITIEPESDILSKNNAYPDDNGSIVADNAKIIVGPDGGLYEVDDDGIPKRLDDDIDVDDLDTEIGASEDYNPRGGRYPIKEPDPTGPGVEPKGKKANIIDGIAKALEAIGDALKEFFF